MKIEKIKWNGRVQDLTYLIDEIAKRYAEEALKEAAELCDDYEDRRGEHKVNILNLINELK